MTTVEMADPLVSILLISYQHAKTIGTALRSILKQKAIEYELIIADDGSTDGTLEIITEFEPHFKDVHLIARNRNIGIMPNFLDALSHCRGTYIALLDGDDCWLDSEKLCEQVAFMVSHPQYSVCGHQIETVNVSTASRSISPRLTKRDLTLKAFFLNTPLHTSSVMYRKSMIMPLPEQMKNLTHWDWGLLFWARQHGKAKQLHKVMSRYNKHTDGIWAFSSKLQRRKQFVHNRSIMLKTSKFPLSFKGIVEWSRMLCFLSKQWARIVDTIPRKQADHGLWLEHAKNSKKEFYF